MKEVMKVGGFTILTGLGATLVAGMLGWLFSTTLENKITFAPVVSAIEDLNTNIKKQEKRDKKQELQNTMEHNLIIDKLQKINTRINVNETKLFRVMTDCDENHNDIKDCKRLHKGE